MRIQIYRDSNNAFRWHIISRGRIIADSGEAYHRKIKMMRTLKNMIAKISSSKFQLEDTTGNPAKPTKRKAKR